jgi:pantoate--beta-alanine ligase
MKVIRKKKEMRLVALDARADGRAVGLVPTMGFFHEGHLQLMRRARAECDVVVVTLFVNPTQFGAGEDLESYPRNIDRDRALTEAEGVDYLFVPAVEEMYPEGSSTSVEVAGLSAVMCGCSRPDHFQGVATVVAKLFNIVPATRAYFGQKDAQQLVVIRRMAADLDFDIEIIPVPTVREQDGLAMSSRNMYLLPDERGQAVALFRSLEQARRLVESGERRAGAVSEAMQAVLSAYPLVDLEYISICDNIFLKPLDELSGEVLIAVAARLGRARLIDNVLLDVE